ncbi:acyl-CoA desaturase [Parasphingorhabdus cellanae]|uniref:Acyl-CoA desaturase n=2 Tax=Parasphingorhabdus cellanae TaxID=2806553 RepID=A0ABX7T841_9SPHN|nr:acyl-CoA desaturase [Parasphingorhabdus cellanae]
MEPVIRIDGSSASADLGQPVLDAPKLVWNGSMLVFAIIFAIPYFTFSALLMFFCLTYATLLLGHSVGMHRMLIHRTFICSKPVERFLIYIGTLVGVAGPHGILRVHDIRDWAQRQPRCHDFFSHRRSLLKDLRWQLFYRFEFEKPPEFFIEANVASDRFYIFLEKTWRWHQILLAILLYAIGGIPWVIWGICMRVIVSAAGHWTITHFCHRPGQGDWDVKGASVQASNLPGLGLLTYGECWHNNHHAFPESARIGLEDDQHDPAWWVIKWLGEVGLAHNIGLPRAKSSREDLTKRLI